MLNVVPIETPSVHRSMNADILAAIVTEFIIAAKEYVAYKDYVAFKEELAFKDYVLHKDQIKDPLDDLARANTEIRCFKDAVAKYVEHIVSNPDQAAKHRDSIFRDIGFFEGLSHTSRIKKNDQGMIFDEKLAPLVTAIRDWKFMASVSHRRLKQNFGLK